MVDTHSNQDPEESPAAEVRGTSFWPEYLPALAALALFVLALFWLFHRFSANAPHVEFVRGIVIDCMSVDGTFVPCKGANAAETEDTVLPLSIKPKPYSAGSRDQTLPRSLIVDVDIIQRGEQAHGDYSLFVDDCIERMSIDGRPVFTDTFPICPYPNAVELDLAPYLQKPRTHVSLALSNKIGGFLFDIVPKTSALSFAGVPLLFAAACLCFFCFVLWRYSAGSPFVRVSLVALFCLGALLRASYFLATARHEREHDYIEHLKYLELFVTKSGMPAFNECFMCRHSPLYYWLQGVWMRSTGVYPQDAGMLFACLHAASFFLSLLTLALMLSCARTLLAEESKGRFFLLMLLLSVFPGIILASGRINNDVLAYPLLFASWLCIWRWWQRGQGRYLGFSLAFICLGLSVKKLSLVLLPILLLLILLHRDMKLREKGASLLATAFCVGLSYLSLFSMREVIPGKASQRLQGVFVPNSLSDFTTFNLSRVFERLYNIPWNAESRLEIFWEYFYRSLFFGEFVFPAELEWIARAMLVAGVILTLFLLLGLYGSFRRGLWYRELPLLGILFIPPAVLLALRLYTHALPMQDFRYIPLFALAVSYYVVQGVRDAGVLVVPAVLAASSLSAAFFLSL